MRRLLACKRGLAGLWFFSSFLLKKVKPGAGLCTGVIFSLVRLTAPCAAPGWKAHGDPV
jgi:hypothetical protein